LRKNKVYTFILIIAVFVFVIPKNTEASINPYLDIEIKFPHRALINTSQSGVIKITTHFCLDYVKIEWLDPDQNQVSFTELKAPSSCNSQFPNCSVGSSEPKICEIPISSPIFKKLGKYQVWIGIWTSVGETGLSTGHWVTVDKCGNGQLEEYLNEQCDGSEFPPGVSCETLGYKGGILKCTDDCKLDTSGCIRETPAVPPSTLSPTLPNPLGYTTFGDLIEKIFHFLFIASLVLTPFVIAFGGFLMTTGLPSNIALGKRIIKWAVSVFIGIAFLRLLASLFKDLFS